MDPVNEALPNGAVASVKEVVAIAEKQLSSSAATLWTADMVAPSDVALAAVANLDADDLKADGWDTTCRRNEYPKKPDADDSSIMQLLVEALACDDTDDNEWKPQTEGV